MRLSHIPFYLLFISHVSLFVLSDLPWATGRCGAYMCRYFKGQKLVRYGTVSYTPIWKLSTSWRHFLLIATFFLKESFFLNFISFFSISYLITDTTNFLLNFIYFHLILLIFSSRKTSYVPFSRTGYPFFECHLRIITYREIMNKIKWK